MAQLICFVESSRFFFLSDQNFIHTDYGPGTNDKILYKNTNEPLSLDDFNLKKAHKAAIVVIPDSFYEDYSPINDFKFLFHRATPDDKKYPLLTNPNCKGVHYSNESENSIYERVAYLLFNNTNFQETFDTIYGEIKMVDPKIRVITDYLHNCLNNQFISEATQDLNDLSVDISFLKGKTFKNFTDIRDNLLSQCDFNMQNS